MLDPVSGRRLLRQSAARAAATLLGRLRQQMYLLENCLAIVLVHFLQVGVWACGGQVVKLAVGCDWMAMTLFVCWCAMASALQGRHLLGGAWWCVALHQCSI